jgi:glycosyltransferase involved in cell wall biosynthesis
LRVNASSSIKEIVRVAKNQPKLAAEPKIMAVDRPRSTGGKPLVSVILPCYGMGKYIAEALASIEAQTYRNWEVIAVDDAGPEDGTKGKVEAFAARHTDRSIRYVRHETNLGAGSAGAARNTGIAAAHGTLLAFLDPDDLWPANYLELHVRAFAENPDIGLTYSRAHLVGEDGRPTGVVYGATDEEAATLPYSLYARNFVTSAVVCRRDIVQACGGYEPGMLHADWDFLLQLLEHGCKFHFVPDGVFYYRKHPDGASSLVQKMRNGDIALRKKHMTRASYRDFIAEHVTALEVSNNELRARVAALEWKITPWSTKLRWSLGGKLPWARRGWRWVRSFGRRSGS